MCLVIDSNTIAAVFDATNAKHAEFSPVTRWLFKGKGKVVYGGRKYRSELARMARYRPILVELERKGKTVNLGDPSIDARENRIAEMLRKRGVATNDKRFNDAHIVAIVAESGVRVVCTEDVSSFRFLLDISFYDRSTDRPSLYTGSRNGQLLSDQYLGRCCRE
jgi:hypothetical protein